jgi:hypothetical protein
MLLATAKHTKKFETSTKDEFIAADKYNLIMLFLLGFALFFIREFNQNSQKKYLKYNSEHFLDNKPVLM